MIAATASLYAVTLELSFAKDAHGVTKDLRVRLATVVGPADGRHVQDPRGLL